MAHVVRVVDRFGGGERVGCPVQRRDVDVDECQGCSRLKDLDLQAAVPYVVCAEPSFSWLPELSA